jgi:hypothetical protein
MVEGTPERIARCGHLPDVGLAAFVRFAPTSGHSITAHILPAAEAPQHSMLAATMGQEFHFSVHHSSSVDPALMFKLESPIDP